MHIGRPASPAAQGGGIQDLAVHGDRPRVRLGQARADVGERALAGPRNAAQSDHRVGPYVQIDALQRTVPVRKINFHPFQRERGSELRRIYLDSRFAVSLGRRYEFTRILESGRRIGPALRTGLQLTDQWQRAHEYRRQGKNGRQWNGEPLHRRPDRDRG